MGRRLYSNNNRKFKIVNHSSFCNLLQHKQRKFKIDICTKIQKSIEYVINPRGFPSNMCWNGVTP